ncbi:MAG TPA: hypothetical protein VF704_00675 [Allosphingosinicella sp.]|jgi:hypothetical protein
MRLLCIPLLILTAAAAPGASAPGNSSTASERDTARSEIERILEADNLDSDRLGPSEVVEIIAGIDRGGAPQDFWQAYQAHVQAWRRLADIFDRISRQQGESTFVEGEEELVAAEEAVNTTFEEVERIARQYGARLPPPRGEVVPTI